MIRHNLGHSNCECLSTYEITIFLNFGIQFQEEVCTTEELTKIEHPTECPTPIGTPTDCLNDCWSPGVDDVDCPTGTVVIR